jgi:hypothetical protein
MTVHLRVSLLLLFVVDAIGQFVAMGPGRGSCGTFDKTQLKFIKAKYQRVIFKHV